MRSESGLAENLSIRQAKQNMLALLASKPAIQPDASGRSRPTVGNFSFDVIVHIKVEHHSLSRNLLRPDRTLIVIQILLSSVSGSPITLPSVSDQLLGYAYSRYTYNAYMDLWTPGRAHIRRSMQLTYLTMTQRVGYL